MGGENEKCTLGAPSRTTSGRGGGGRKIAMHIGGTLNNDLGVLHRSAGIKSYMRKASFDLPLAAKAPKRTPCRRAGKACIHGPAASPSPSSGPPNMFRRHPACHPGAAHEYVCSSVAVARFYLPGKLHPGANEPQSPCDGYQIPGIKNFCGEKQKEVGHRST